jgi:hypothetical protein
LEFSQLLAIDHYSFMLHITQPQKLVNLGEPGHHGCHQNILFRLTSHQDRDMNVENVLWAFDGSGHSSFVKYKLIYL